MVGIGCIQSISFLARSTRFINDFLRLNKQFFGTAFTIKEDESIHTFSTFAAANTIKGINTARMKFKRR